MKKIFLLISSSLLLIPLSVGAMVVRGEQSYVLSKGETLEKNLYAAGNNVSILGEAKQDVFAAGGTINILGSVAKDLAAAGGTIILSGPVGDDVRLAGGNVTLSSQVGGELLAAAGQFNLNQGARVKGDARLGVGNLLLAGDLDGDLFVAGGTIEIQGKVAGNVKIKASEKLVIGSQAEIGGDLDYSAPEKVTIQEGAKINGKVTFKEYLPSRPGKPGKKGLWGVFTLAWLWKLIMILTAALVIHFLFKKQLEQMVKYTLANFGKETLRGFIILVVLPIAAIVCFVTVIGVALGGLGLLVYALMAFLAMILGPIVLGSFLFRNIFKKDDFGVDWKSIVLGVLIIKLVGLVPIVGWIFSLTFFLASFGSLFWYLYRHFKSV